MVDEWTNRTPGSTEFPRVETDGLKQLVGTVRRIRDDVRESTSNLLRTAGIFLTEEGMRIASSLRVEGDLTSTGAASFGGTLDVSGTANIDGELNVTGDAVFSGNLAVPNGSIDNAALANPVLPSVVKGAAAGFGTADNAWEDKASATLTVPEGFTKAVVSVNAGAKVTNTSSRTGYLQVRPRLGSTNGNENINTGVVTSQQAVASASMSELLENLIPGATITATAQTATSDGWGASASNSARVTVTVMWLR